MGPKSIMEIRVMTQGTSPNSAKPKVLAARRLALLASVGAVGAAMLFAGLPGYPTATATFGTPTALAAETGMAHPVGFADIVAKV
jgi:hypothetical protein